MRLLGEDSVAETFLARPLGVNNRRRLLGLKVAHTQLANDEAFRRAFLYQARIGVALRHPNVVRTYEVVAVPGQCYAVTEFLRGRVLSRITDDRGLALPLELHIGVLLQILEGLRYIHELGSKEGKWLGLVHRNLSPARVFVGYDGRVRILDAGLARVHAIASVRRDNPNTVMRYSAPEQCLGRKVDCRSDLYAVGVMLWEAMVGQPRQFSKTLAEALDARVRNREPSIEHFLPGAPPFLAAICQRALSWSPDERYASAAELYRDLSRYVTTTGQHVGQDALSRTLHAHYAADIAAVDQLLGDEPSPSSQAALTAQAFMPSAPPASVSTPRIDTKRFGPRNAAPSSGVPSGGIPSSVAPSSVAPSVPPSSAGPSSVPPSSGAPDSARAGGRKHWGFRTPGPSTISIVPEAASRMGRALNWHKLASGAAVGAVAGLIIGVLLRPAASDDAASRDSAIGDPAPVVAPLLPHPDLHTGSQHAEAAALPELPAVEALAAELPATPSSAPSAAEPSAAEPPAAAVTAAAVPAPAPETSRFVVKPPEPAPVVDTPDEPFVVKPVDGAESDAPAEVSTKRRSSSASKRRKRAAEAAAASALARDAASRAPRPIDETDPYADPASSKRRERGAR